MEARGSSVRAFINDQEYLSFKDDRFPRGQVGIQTFDSRVRLRNFKVTAPDGKVLWDDLPVVPQVRPDPAANQRPSRFGASANPTIPLPGGFGFGGGPTGNDATAGAAGNSLQPGQSDGFVAGSKWSGTRTFTKGPMAGRMTTFELRVIVRQSQRFVASVTAEDGVASRGSIDGEINDSAISWRERNTPLAGPGELIVAGKIDGGTVRFNFRSQNGAEGEGVLTSAAKP
jgi:hypothetical protein